MIFIKVHIFDCLDLSAICIDNMFVITYKIYLYIITFLVLANMSIIVPKYKLITR